MQPPLPPGPRGRAGPSNTELHGLAARFERFGREASENGSDLYARLSACVSASRELLALAALAPREPVPNLLFAAVHHLLLGGARHALADHYPSVGRAPSAGGAGLCADFAGFCALHRAELARLIATRLVQTNEVARCAWLLPAFELVHELGGRRPLALVEIGASAGLNLLFDRYSYEYSGGRRAGRADSPVNIRCELRGGSEPPLRPEPPPVASRLGLDLAPVDLADAGQRAWLRALVWPEHAERAARLERAVSLALRPPGPAALVAGDAARELPAALRSRAAEHTLCVFHSAVMVQLEPTARLALDAQLRAASRARPVFRVSAEDDVLALTTYAGGESAERELAALGGHGSWMRWQG